MSEYELYLTTTGISFFVSSVVVLLNNFILYRHRNIDTRQNKKSDQQTANKNVNITTSELQRFPDGFEPIIDFSNTTDQPKDDLASIKRILLNQLERTKLKLYKKYEEINKLELTEENTFIETKIDHATIEISDLQNTLNYEQILKFLSYQLTIEKKLLDYYKSLDYEQFNKIIQQIQQIQDIINKKKEDAPQLINNKYLILQIIHSKLLREKLDIKKEIEELDKDVSLFSLNYLNNYNKKVDEDIITILNIQREILSDNQSNESVTDPLQSIIDNQLKNPYLLDDQSFIPPDQSFIPPPPPARSRSPPPQNLFGPPPFGQQPQQQPQQQQIYTEQQHIQDNLVDVDSIRNYLLQSVSDGQRLQEAKQLENNEESVLMSKIDINLMKAPTEEILDDNYNRIRIVSDDNLITQVLSVQEEEKKLIE